MVTACSASQAGFLTLDGTVARKRERHPAAATATERLTDSSYADPSSASWSEPTGRCWGPVARQSNEKDASVTPTTNGSIATPGSSAGMVVATVERSRAARATATPARRKSTGRWAPTPTSRIRRSALLPRTPPGTTYDTISPALPVACSASRTPSRSRSLAASASAAAPGPSMSDSPGNTGNAMTSAPATAWGTRSSRVTAGGLTCGGRVMASANDILEGVTEGACLVGVQLDHQAA